jgi:predicted double-glycine peptidase
MRQTNRERPDGPGWGSRWLAGVVIAAAAAGSLILAVVSRNPLEPLRAVTRWSLERHGARFVSQGRARLQSSLNDCGPTALADLLELSGLPARSADSLRLLAAAGPVGTSLGDLQAAAARAGLQLISVRWDPSDLELLPLPSLVWVDRSHFVVIAGKGAADSIEVLDPAAGRYRMATARFAARWSGVALISPNNTTSRRTADTRSASRPHRLRGTQASRPLTKETFK